ncbi:MAG: TonB-dependent receptor [Chlorobi bacterium]|nr:TonB-dependent receptor [Chlorobiota bacterium]
MKKKIYFISIILTLISWQIKAQDTLQIDEVIKTASLQNTFKNSNEELIDSTLQTQYKNTSIDEVLAIQTSSQIKSYGGLGNLSSISLRGSSANHTAINWNGFAINSATTGGADLSLIQTGFFNEIKVVPGASSSLYGSGTFGGALELNNYFNSEEGLNISLGSEIGSFETYKYFAGASFSNKKVSYKISANKIDAKNNFTFYDNYKFDNPLEERKHNSLKSFNIMQSFILKLPKNNSIESGIWYINKEKEIPEIAGSYIDGNKMQNDSIFRTYLRWKKLGRNYLLTVSSAYFSEYLHYTDKTNSYDTEYYINSEISANNYFADISYRYYFNNKFIFDFAGIVNHQKVTTSNYENEDVSETNYSLISSLKYKMSGYDFRLNFRNEFLDTKKYIPLVDFGASKNFLQNKLIIKANFSNKFRRPTFNEKYWQPGGNINIKEETGTNAELSFKYLLKKSIFNVTFYHSTINDMIQWVPVDGVWSAQNNKKVKINGIEANFKQNFSTGFFKHKIYVNYNYTNALLTEVYSNDELESSQKLIYVPENTGKIFIASSYKKFTLSWATQVIGKRYTTQENNEDYSLPAYSLSNIYASYNVVFERFRLMLNAKVLNIFNEQYEVIKSYPSSRRAFYLGIILEFQAKNK